MREWMIATREKAGMTVKAMAKLCQCTEFLLRRLEEDDWVTHPHIASRIAYVYGLDLDQFNKLVPKARRMAVLPDPIAPPTADNYQDAQCHDRWYEDDDGYVDDSCDEFDFVGVCVK